MRRTKRSWACWGRALDNCCAGWYRIFDKYHPSTFTPPNLFLLLTLCTIHFWFCTQRSGCWSSNTVRNIRDLLRNAHPSRVARSNALSPPWTKEQRNWLTYRLSEITYIPINCIQISEIFEYNYKDMKNSMASYLIYANNFIGFY